MVMGEVPSRWLMSALIAVLPLVVHHVLLADAPHTLARYAVELALVLLNLWVAVRVVRTRSTSGDHRTYMLHTYWFCAVLASGSIML